MPRSGRPVMMIRRSAWSLMSARKAGALIAPTRESASFASGTVGSVTAGARALIYFQPGAHALPMREFRPLARLATAYAGGEFVERRLRFPVRLNSIGEQLHLRVGERPTVGSRKRGHGCARPTISDHSQQLLVGNNRHKERIIERRSGAQFSGGTVTAGTVCRVKLVEIRDLVRRDRFVGWIGPCPADRNPRRSTEAWQRRR